ncbi:hypothetical protein MIN45_P0860 [Methylomarinovum tepidoasis]|uniref:SpoVT-AbrB domain-containing protein n=1 Tax=Methylomarinovum tepidoasis TaxID=2840183 RepID=A0AAU9CGM8_9GAMM|nr:AbrB/MazE/SpoVT family DNA-binding domain-containing protein [Methylomarinovum sp. IN45]BCX88491.1 hypothetical protein MIN45_P0860 [Methylomarinovum sp. IN45]
MEKTLKSPEIYPLPLDAQGRLLIPKRLRRAMGLKPGDVVVAWVEDGRLVLKPRRDLEQELWAMFEDVEEDLAETLIAERREEAAREN